MSVLEELNGQKSRRRNRGFGGKQSSSRKGVVDLADARVRINSRSPDKPAKNLMEELDHIRSLLDEGLSAESKNTSRISNNSRSQQPVNPGSGTMCLVDRPGNAGTVSRSLAAVASTSLRNQERNSTSKRCNRSRCKLVSPTTTTAIIQKQSLF